MMKTLPAIVVTVALMTMGFVTMAQALQANFFGEDLGPGDGTGIRLNATPNADAARAAFFSLLSPGIGSEGFDSFTPGTPLISLPPITFTQPSGIVSATLGGLGFVDTELAPNTANATGQYPISAPHYLNTASWPSNLSSLAFSLTFSQPQAAFGFSGIDIGDEGTQISLQFELTDATTLNETLPHTLGTPTTTGGSVLYFGHLDTENLFTKVTFLSPVSTDSLAFDNVTIASAAQIAGAAKVVPESNSLLLVGSGLSLGGFILWRKRSRQRRHGTYPRRTRTGHRERRDDHA